MIRIVINGAFGKMGRLACDYLATCPQVFSIVGQLGRADDLKERLHQLSPDVVLDLTSADCVYDNALTMIHSGIPTVIGTSGLSLPQIQHLSEISQAKSLGVLVVPNFSLGAALLLMAAKKIISFFPEVEVIEGHHTHKKDAPSGTAKYTAQSLAASCQRVASDGQEEALIARGVLIEGIPVHSVRLSGMVAEQEILFGQQGEMLRLQHQVIDRMAYMPGLKLACTKVVGLSKLYYGMDVLLGMENE